MGFVFSIADCLVFYQIIQAVELQTKIENAGGERLRNQKAKVERIKSVSGYIGFKPSSLE